MVDKPKKKEGVVSLFIGRSSKGFTIVELLIVVVVIAILAAITIVSYNGITTSAKESALKSDLSTAAKKLNVAKIQDGSFPATYNAPGLTYNRDGDSFCITGAANGSNFHVTEAGSVEEGDCPSSTLFMQTVTNANCPAERTMAVDARDNHTYWIKKMPDGKCWMLTNLAYAGGGTNAYGDVMPTGDGTNGTLNGPDNSGSTTYTLAKYYTHADANPTTNPTPPSTNEAGGGTVAAGERQYGYHYNWCAAMGGQVATSACASATTPSPDPSISICPAGWRLPTGVGITGELQLLANSINATDNAAGSTNLQQQWLAQFSGYWDSGFNYQGGYGYFWSSSQASDAYAHYLSFYSSYVRPANYNSKGYGFAVRCLAI